MDWLHPLLVYVIGPAMTVACGVWAYRRKAQVDSEKAPLDVLVKSIESRDRQMEVIMANHLEHDRQERDGLIKTLTELNAASLAQTQAIRELSGDIRDGRQESTDRAQILHEKLNAIHLDVRGRT